LLAAQCTLSDIAGTWRFEATYNSQVCKTLLYINAPPTIKVDNPNGGEHWDRKPTHALKWTDNFGGDVNITLHQNGTILAPNAYKFFYMVHSNTRMMGSFGYPSEPFHNLPLDSSPQDPGRTIRLCIHGCNIVQQFPGDMKEI
jgi:hypothetical protein